MSFLTSDCSLKPLGVTPRKRLTGRFSSSFQERQYASATIVSTLKPNLASSRVVSGGRICPAEHYHPAAPPAVTLPSAALTPVDEEHDLPGRHANAEWLEFRSALAIALRETRHPLREGAAASRSSRPVRPPGTTRREQQHAASDNFPTWSFWRITTLLLRILRCRILLRRSACGHFRFNLSQQSLPVLVECHQLLVRPLLRDGAPLPTNP